MRWFRGTSEGFDERVWGGRGVGREGNVELPKEGGKKKRQKGVERDRIRD